MVTNKIISHKFPYIPIVITIRRRIEKVEALVDTGFEGEVIVPKGLFTNGDLPDTILPWQLADGSIVLASVYTGKVKIEKIGTYTVVVATIGDEVIIGRGLIDRFRLILDHGRRIILEP